MAPTTAYDHYKAWQDDFANFLGQTGLLCQAPPHLTRPEGGEKTSVVSTPGTTGRQKGKARKATKEKNKRTVVDGPDMQHGFVQEINIDGAIHRLC